MGEGLIKLRVRGGGRKEGTFQERVRAPHEGEGGIFRKRGREGWRGGILRMRREGGVDR